MTCLTTNDVAGIPHMWEEYDRRMALMLNTDIISLAARATDRPTAVVRDGLAGRKLAVVPVTSGGGVIPGFVESVASIGWRLGMNAAVMNYPDGDGFQQALDLGADFIISADDHRFLARDCHLGRLADNNIATSSVFVAALEALCGGSLRDKDVLVLGAGVVGRGAAVRLVEVGAYPLVYDPDQKRAMAAMGELTDGEMVNSQRDLLEALKRTNIIFDATPVPEALPVELWPEQPIVSAPGVPLAWPMEWMYPGAAGRLWHDVLQAGTAAMLARLT